MTDRPISRPSRQQTEKPPVCFDYLCSGGVFICSLRDMKDPGFSSATARTKSVGAMLSPNERRAERAPSKRDCGICCCGAKIAWRSEERHPGSLLCSVRRKTYP